MRFLIVTALLYFFTSFQFTVKAQTSTSLIQEFKKGGFSGSMLFRNQNDTIVHFSDGFQDFISGEGLYASSRLAIGGITQSFTAYLIIKLEEDGKLNLDQTIDPFFTENDIPKKSIITIRQLLEHSSGLPDYTKDSVWKNGSTKAYTLDGFIDTFFKYGLDFEPGTSVEFSASNYYVLGVIAERVCKKDYETLVNEYIITPLSLDETSIKRVSTPRLDEALGFSYDSFSKQLELAKIDHYSTNFATSSIISTASDLIKWISFCHTFFEKRLKKELKETDLISMKYGWIFSKVDPVLGYQAIVKGKKISIPENENTIYMWMWGENPGFKSIVVKNLNTDKSGAILLNTDNQNIFDYYEKAWALE